MKKSALEKMSHDSAEYVVAHGFIQKSKRRNFSVSYRGILNPKKAFETATNELMARRLLKFDAFDVAEKLTNSSYRTNPLINDIGLMMHVSKVRGLKATLEKLDDTNISNQLENYLRIVQEEGFQILLALPFSNESGQEEKLYICFHKTDGILLVFDTYGGKSVNGGHFYYNWKPNDNDPRNGDTVLSSGGYRKEGSELIWSGDHDCREALRLHIRDLREHGEFVTPWVERPFIWLLHYMDTRDSSYDYEAINKERLAMLPSEVVQSL